MKAKISGILLAGAVVACGAAMGAGYTVQRADTGDGYETYEVRTTTRTYSSEAPRAQRMTYARPTTNRGQMYRSYNSETTTSRATTTRSMETTRTKLRRKYYIAHPFFQPTEGKFGSITDFSYNRASYDIKVTPVAGIELNDTTGDWKASSFAIKEDLSFGITDRFALLGMARYDTTKYKFSWDQTGMSDSFRDSGINYYGLGLQWRFVDTDEWIGMLKGEYIRQKDSSNQLLAELKAGYKIAKSTIYGVGRAWYINYDEEILGNGFVRGEDGYDYFLIYDKDASDSGVAELGLGVFSVLGEDWTLNLEGMFSYYDWHNQFSIMGAAGWQPNDWFALNLYGKFSLYDTIEDHKYETIAYDSVEFTNPPYCGTTGRAKLNNYNEMSLGVQVMFMF